ncbi:hypothetical protein WJX64_16610 [Leifsonia sp. YIM 134122]|uniref:Integral membrane protein n=1 Tax=Leifsonia stereocauli TaxID=3134136 RepID=A0ABU9W846_9MICO
MARLSNAELQRQLELLAAENAELRLKQGEAGGALNVESEELRRQQEETASAIALEAEEQRREQAAAAAALAAENAALRAELEAARSAAETVPITPLDDVIVPPAGKRRPHTSRWWAVLSAFLIVIGLILAPTAVIASWAKNQLSSTETFVATFAPLADDPAVQALVTDQVVLAINEQIDVQGLTDSLFDGVEELGLAPKASAALDLLRAPAAAGIQSLIQTSVTRFVESDAFSAIWTQALTVTHNQVLATLNGDENAAIGIDAQGQIGVQLAPIIEEVKRVLVNQGIGFAAQIPTIDKTIVIAQSDQAVLAQSLYGVAVGVGTWLPWVAIAFLIAGVLVARRRIVALLGASIGLALVMILLAAGLGVGRIVTVANLAPAIMSASAAGVIYDQVLTFISATITAVTVLAVTVAVVGWLASSYRPAVKLRLLFLGWVAWVRAAGAKRGVTTGRFGEWLYRQRVVVRVAIAVIAAAVVLFVRPLSPALIIWTAVIAIVLLGISELLQRPVVTVPDEADEDTPIVVA